MAYYNRRGRGFGRGGAQDASALGAEIPSLPRLPSRGYPMNGAPGGSADLLAGAMKLPGLGGAGLDSMPTAMPQAPTGITPIQQSPLASIPRTPNAPLKFGRPGVAPPRSRGTGRGRARRRPYGTYTTPWSTGPRPSF